MSSRLRLSSSDADTTDTAIYSVAGSSNDTSLSGYDRCVVGTYGALYLNSDSGAYEYVPDDSAINALTANATDSFMLMVTDGSNASASRLLTVNITSANDSPELTASVPSVSYIETASDDSFGPTYGTLSGTDRDTDAILVYSLQGSATSASLPGYDVSKSGRFGMLYLNTNSGAYVYVPNDGAIEGQPENSQSLDEFVFEVSDGTSSRSADFAVMVVGAGDPPILSDGNDKVTLTETNATLTATGALKVSDNDLSDAVSLVTRISVDDSSTAAALPNNATLLAMLSLTPTELLSDGDSITETVNWRFNSNSQHFNNLAAGETLVLTYTINASDNGSPSLSGSSTITVTIHGTNDGPVLTEPNIIELSDTSSDDALLPIIGQLISSDLDHNASLTYSLANQVADTSQNGFNISQAGQFGTAYLNTSTGAYIYVPNKGVIESLKESRNETFSVRVSDGSASSSQTLRVTIEAGNDTPVLGAITAIGHIDTRDNDSYGDITGVLASSDRDGDRIIYAVSGQVNETNVIDSVVYTDKRIGRYGTLYLNAQSGAYRFMANDAVLEGLKTSSSEIFSIVANDGSAADTKLLTVNINATNDTPLLSASVNTIDLTDTANNDRMATTAGVLTSADRDAQETAIYGISGGIADTNRSGYDIKKVGTYGTLHLSSSTGVYEFVANDAAINALLSDSSESFELTVIDGSNASVSQMLTVNLTAANDAPEVTTSLPSFTYVDTTGNDTFSPMIGTLNGIDRDSGASLSYAIQDGAADVSQAGYTYSLTGSYGTLYLNQTTGAYAYLPNTIAINAQTGNARDEFTLVVSDGTATQTTGVIAWIVGASDQPVISDGVDRVELTESNDDLVTNGSITVTDNDPSDQVSLTCTVSVGGTSSGTPPSETLLLGMLTLSPSSVLNDSSITAQVAWSFDGSSTHFDYLAEGQTLVLSYNLTATDTGSPALSDTTTVVITITGSNDGPVLAAPTAVSLSDTMGDDTLLPLNGQLTSNDLDHNAVLSYSLASQVADTSRSGFDFSKHGRFGTLYLNSSTGAYSYLPKEGAIEALKANANEAFAVRVFDGTASSTQTLNVDILATNDIPTLSASLTILNYTDTPLRDSFNSATGSLVSMDRDAGDSATYSTALGVADTSRTGYNLREVGIFGTLFMNSQTGAYVYVPNDVAINALTSPNSDSFALRVTDGSGNTVSQLLTVSITGRNDVPVVTNSVAATQGRITEACHNDDGSLFTGTATATGTLAASDVDASDTRSWSLLESPSDTYGIMAINATTGQWTFTLNNTLSSTQALYEGQVITQSYVVRASDNLGAYVDQTVTLQIHGTNDVPTVTASGAQTSGTVKENGHNDDGSIFNGTATVSNRITASDVDENTAYVYDLEGTNSSRFGQFALNRETGEWTYTLNNTLSATQNLREGQSVDERYRVLVTDEHGAQVRETITITVEGSNDAPTLVGSLLDDAFLQGEQVNVPTAQLFTDIDNNAGALSYSSLLPPGLTIDTQTGVISGAGTRPGDYDIIIRATDEQGAWVETSWSVRINAPAQNDSTSGATSGQAKNSEARFDTGGTGYLSDSSVKQTNSFASLNGGIPGFGGQIPVPNDGGTSIGVTEGLANLGGNVSPINGNANANAATITTSVSEVGSGSEVSQPAGVSPSSSVETGSASGEMRSSTADAQAPAQERTNTNVGADGQLQLSKTEASDPAPNQNDSALRAVERVNVAVNSNGQISLRQDIPQANETPTGIMLVEVSQQQSGVQIEIADFRRNQVAQYRATLLNGSPLPDWIKVDAATGKVTAEPGRDVQLIELRFIAEDTSGAVRSLEIKIDLSGTKAANEQSTKTSELMNARPAFMTQLASQQQQWDGYGEQLLSVFTE